MGVTGQQWSQDLLTALLAPVTPGRMAAMETWFQREGGQARNNPLGVGTSTTWASYEAGVAGTADFIVRNSNYAQVLATIRGSDDPRAILQTIQDSPWAASRYGGTLVADLAGVNPATVNPHVDTPTGGPISPAGAGGAATFGATSVAKNWLLDPTGGMGPLIDLFGGLFGSPSDALASGAQATAQGIAAGIFQPLATIAFLAAGLAMVVFGVRTAVAPTLEPARQRGQEAAGLAAAVA